eukprot:1138369-Amphidinium_carterae.2
MPASVRSCLEGSSFIKYKFGCSCCASMTSAGNPSFAYVHGQGTASSGVVATFSWKAWRHEDRPGGQECWWDTARLSDSLGMADSENTAIHRYLRKVKVKLSAALLLVNIPEGTAMRPSRRSAAELRRLGKETPAEPLHDVAVMSTLGILAFLLFYVDHSRSASDKEKGQAILQGFLALAIHADVAFELLRVLPTPEDLAQCAGGGGACVHVEGVRASVSDSEHPHWNVVVLLSRAFAQRTCTCIGAWLRRCLDILVERVNAGLEEGSYTQDPSKAVARPGTKRRIIDEDYKTLTTVEAVQSGRASSAASFARAQSDFSDTNVYRWIASDLLKYQSRCWHSMIGRKECSVTLSHDAGRFGNPAEETLLSVATITGASLDGDFSAWLPCQVQ